MKLAEKNKLHSGMQIRVLGYMFDKFGAISPLNSARYTLADFAKIYLASVGRHENSRNKETVHVEEIET